MPRSRASKLLADMKQVSNRLYNDLTKIHADPFNPAKDILESPENYPLYMHFLSEGTSNFTLICLEDLLGNNKKIEDWDKELKGLLSHSAKVKENLPKGVHSASLEYLVYFDEPIKNLRKQLQKETGYDPHDKDWHLKLSSTPLYKTLKKSYKQKADASTTAPKENPQEEDSLPDFMKPLNFNQEKKESFLRLWKFVRNPELNFEQRVHACLIFELDKELGKRYGKGLLDEFMATFCLDNSKDREVRAYRCRYRDKNSKETKKKPLKGSDPEFEERVRKLFLG